MAVLAVWLGEVGRGRLGILLALLNCLAAFTGTLMVAAGLYILLKIDSKLSVLEGYTSGPLPAMLISSGAVVAGIHLAGAKICLSVAFYRTRERCMSCLMLYQLAVIALFCLVIATSIMTTTHGSFADDIIRKKFLNAMGKYANDVKVKETIDLMQVEFRCCGGKGHSDWFSVPWINSKYMDPYQSRTAGDNVPWSCCDPEASRPCIHDRVTMEGRNYDPVQHLTLYATGCVEAIIRYQRNSVLKAATGISCAVLALQVVAFVLCRYLQTSIDTAYARGRPRSTTQGYFCARCPCSDASLSDIRSYSSLRSDTHRYHTSPYRHRKRSSSSSSSDSHKGKRLWHGLRKFGKRRNSSNYKLKHHPSDLSSRYHHHRDSDERQHRHHRDSDERRHHHHRDSDERRHHHHRDSDERRRRHRDSDSDDERNQRHKRRKSSHSLQLEAAERFLAETPHHADSDIGLGRGRGLEDMDIDISGHSGEGKPDKESKLEKKERKQTEKQEKKDKKQEKKDKKQGKKQEKKDKKQEKKDKKEEKKQEKKDKKQDKKDKKSERKNEKKTKKDAKKKEKEGSKDNKKREMKEKKEKKKTEKKEKKQTKDKDKKSGMKSKKSSDKKKNEKSKDKTMSKSDKKKEKKQKKSKDRKDASKNKKKKVTDTKAKKKSKTGKAKTKTKKEKSPRSKPKKTKMKKTKRPKSKLKKTKMKKTKRPKTKLKKHKIKKPKRSKFKRKKPKFKKPKHSKKFGSKKSGRRGMFGKKRR